MPRLSLAAAEAFLHRHIPLAAAMGTRLEYYENGTLSMLAPLGPNHNHLGTAFGGSLAAVATLAGYALLWLEMADATVHLVIKQSTLRYRRPVRGDLRALCSAPPAPEMDRFRTEYLAVGRARLTLCVTVVEDGRTCVEFEGEYVAISGAL